MNLIRSVAIIGGGPSGIACLNELVHTSKFGVSSIHKGIKPNNPAFTRVVCFEQNDGIGGVWKHNKVSDPKLPDIDRNISDPNFIYESCEIPSNLSLKNSVICKPDNGQKWSGSAAYEGLFTNIPEKYMRFSYSEYKGLSAGRFLEPLISGDEVMKYLDSVVDKYSLREHIRLRSSVERVEKVDDKWEITIRQKIDGEDKERWYIERFDGVVIANGHCNVPFIPEVKGIYEFVKKYKDVLQHSKSFRGSEEYKGKKVLLCGSGTSCADLYQYIAPVATSITISRRSNSVYGWISECFDECEEVEYKSRIVEYLKDGSVLFEDGSIDKYDKIILSTGYHYHFPFLKEEDGNIEIFKEEGRAVSKIGGLYLYTFSNKDFTIASVGIPTVGVMFHGFEYSAIAIAGVFSGVKKLPSLDERVEWSDGRVRRDEPEVPQRYQGFYLDSIEEQLFGPLYELAPEGREVPLKKGEWSGEEVEGSSEALKKAFFALKAGKEVLV